MNIEDLELPRLRPAHPYGPEIPPCADPRCTYCVLKNIVETGSLPYHPINAPVVLRSLTTVTLILARRLVDQNRRLDAAMWDRLDY
ncbi:MAG: hypothetical protein AAFY97_05180 [Pseudomonadota bacterium]